MDDEQFKIKVIEGLAKNTAITENIHAEVKELKKLPERMSSLEKDMTIISNRLDQHISTDEISMKALKKWIFVMTVIVGVIAIGTFGKDEVISWMMKIFIG